MVVDSVGCGCLKKKKKSVQKKSTDLSLIYPSVFVWGWAHIPIKRPKKLTDISNVNADVKEDKIIKFDTIDTMFFPLVFPQPQMSFLCQVAWWEASATFFQTAAVSLHNLSSSAKKGQTWTVFSHLQISEKRSCYRFNCIPLIWSVSPKGFVAGFPSFTWWNLSFTHIFLLIFASFLLSLAFPLSLIFFPPPPAIIMSPSTNLSIYFSLPLFQFLLSSSAIC